nr:hypothetical protein [uncultured Brevundimonas sp.]
MTPREKVVFKQPCEHCQRMTTVDLTALASGSGDHAELARLADDPAMDFGGFGRSRVSALLAENAALRVACSKSNDEISQTLGKALGYPWFKNDQINFPGATAENGVCVGDHVAESLADESARRITEAERKLAEAERLNDRAADLMRQCTDPERFVGASTLNVYANMRAWLSDLSKEAERG